MLPVLQSGGWDDTVTKGNRLRKQISKEWDVFVKNDFKITKHVRLNLGLRHKITYPPAWSPATSAAVALGDGLFGSVSV